MIAMAAPPVSHDFNADGSDDYPVSVTGYDPATPVNGAARMWSGASKSIIDTIVNTDTNTLFGWAIGSAGDLDADGHDDLIVGEPLWGPSGTLQGRVQVFSGDDSSVLLSATGLYAETGLGRYVAGIGDWNGDGIGDIAASGWDIADLDADGIGDDPIGIVFVISGADGTVLTEIFEPTATALFGYSIFGLGDVTGDGLAELAVVDRGAQGAPGATGRLYIFAGQAHVGALSATDAHRTILNDDATLRGFAAHVDTMHPDLWLDEPTLQIISLTAGGSGGPNEAETTITIRKADGQFVGTKGVRPTLVLAGDVNLDGKVDALDLQESIAQLGTNPQAAGVMPLADLNGDTIVDTHDVALLLDGYGDETDIYEGLWDGSRLLATVGANAGFGTIGGGAGGSPIGGNWGTQPGRRPSDDCSGPHGLAGLTASTPSLVADLLEQDSRGNCSDTSCGTPVSKPQCWSCNEPNRVIGGSIVGGEVRVPIGQLIELEIVGATPSAGTVKCDVQYQDCAATGAISTSPAGRVMYGWTISMPDANGNWTPEPVPAFSENNTYRTTLIEPCKIYRVTAWVKNSYCPGDPRKVGTRILSPEDGAEPNWQVADADPQTGTYRKRYDLAIGERVRILSPLGDDQHQVRNIQHSDNLVLVPDENFVLYRAIQPGSAYISLQIGGSCYWAANFEVHEPKLTFVQCPGLEWWEIGRNFFGRVNAVNYGLKARIRLEPNSVSFNHIEIREGPCPATASGVFVGMFPHDGFHFPTPIPDESVWGPPLPVDPRQPFGTVNGQPSNWIVGENLGDRLEITTTPTLDDNSQGMIVWDIPYQYRIKGEGDDAWRNIGVDVKQVFMLQPSYVVTITKAEADEGGVTGTLQAATPNLEDNPFNPNQICDIGPSTPSP